MTKREMLSLLIKLMGIYAIVQLVPSIVRVTMMFAQEIYQFFSSASSTPFFILALSVFLSPLAWILFCLWVIRKSDVFAARLYPTDAPAGQLTALGTAEVQRLGYHFIGLMLIIRAFPAILMVIYHWIMVNRLYAERGYPRQGHDHSHWISIIIQLAIGLYLFLYPRGLANLWAKIQGKPWPKDDNYDI